jgi:hypothetical protein
VLQGCVGTIRREAGIGNSEPLSNHFPADIHPGNRDIGNDTVMAFVSSGRHGDGLVNEERVDGLSGNPRVGLFFPSPESFTFRGVDFGEANFLRLAVVQYGYGVAVMD